MHLRKTHYCITVVFCALLLVSMLSGIVQTVSNEKTWGGRGNAVNEADIFFDDSYIHEIRLYFSDPNWYDTLYAAHDEDPNDPYFPARFVSHGIELDPIGVRFKGLATFGFGSGNNGLPWGGGQGGTEDTNRKKPFRLDFNMYDDGSGEETTFFGLKKLSLNNGALDPTLMRDKLFLDFARKYVPTPRSVYTRVYVNDEYIGLYLAVENIDNTYVESRFAGEQNGNIYKIDQGGTLSYLGQNQQSYTTNYELKNNEEINNWSDLIELTNVLTNTPIQQLPANLEPIFDVQSALYSLALLDVFCSLDSYIGNARNYYIYHRDDTGQLTFQIWDSNMAFGTFTLILPRGSNPEQYSVFPSSTMSGGGFVIPGRPRNDLTLVKNVLAVPAYNRTYLRDVAQILRECFDAPSVNARIQEISALIREEVLNDPNLTTDPQQFDPGLQQLVTFVTNRAAYLNSQLDLYAQKTDLKLNDLMATNQGTITDNVGDYDPWIEIYNLGPGKVSTSNLFLTDTTTVPNKWTLPTQNIDDGEFLLLWMDGEPNEGSVHAPFTLSSGGGDLYLYLQNGSNFVLVDSISYPVLDADVSFGRYPNGKGLWKMMLDSVTPAQLNLFGNIPDNLVINEFMANNDNAVAGPNNSHPDWIELFNGGSEAVDISGFYLSDDSANLKWQFPAGTVIDASSFLVVWCINSSANSGYANFNLSTEGEFICLVAEDGVTVIDSVPFSRQYDDTSYGRTTDGGSHWDFLTPTCGTTNSLGTVVVPGQSFYAGRIPSGLVINEFMANNDKAVPGPDSSYPDWIELYNGGSETVDLGGYYLSDDPSNPDAWQFPSGTIINAGGFLVVWADNSVYERPLHTSFGLNATGESVCLFAPDAKTLVDSKTFGEQLDDVSYARTVDGGSAWGFLTPTPGQSNTLGEPVDANTHVVQVDVPESIYINEFMANNDNAVPGPNNSHPDWIEIYNGGSETVDLGGLYLSDDPANPDKWQFPSGTIIEPYGFLVIWTDGSSDAEELHASFALNASGEAVCLFAVDAKTLIDSVTFGEQLDDVSYGRVADGGTKWDYLTPTCGQSNSLGEVVVPGEITPVTVPYNLVINELMADNQITIAGPNEDYPDWIELYNGGNVSVDLGGMYLTDNLNNPTKWRFPAGTIIDAGGYLLVWADNSSESSSLHTRFGLNANGEEIGLFANDGTTLIDSVTFDKQLTDISYGRVPDGSQNWEFLQNPSPSWGNTEKHNDNSRSSVWAILLLVGVLAAVCVLIVAGSKLANKRK